MLVPNRHGQADSYRYGFQGQEKDDEVKGEGNSLNYKYRMHDPRVGRFFATDPLAPQYPFNSPYAFGENRVIDQIEREGLEGYFYMLGMQEIDGNNYFQLVQVYQVGQDAPNWVKKQTGEQNYVKGSDGHWHVIPDKIINQSIDKLGSNASEIFAVLNKGGIADAEADMAGGLKAMEEIGGSFDTAMGIVFLYSGLRNIAKNGKKILSNLKTKKPKIITGIADEQIPFLKKADFDNLPNTGTIDPKSIRFSQGEISKKFRKGKNGEDYGEVADLTKKLIDNPAMDIKPIRIVEKDGKIFTLDNRRLKAYQDAGVDVPFRKIDNFNGKTTKFSTKNEGTSVRFFEDIKKK